LIAARNWPTQGERATPAVAGDRRGDQGRHPANGVDARGALTSATATTRSTPRCCSSLSAVPASDDRACAPRCWRSPTELNEDGLVLRYRTEETDDGPTGRRGLVHHLLVLLCRRCGASVRSPSQEPLRATAVVRQRCISTPRRSSRAPTPLALPAGVHPPGADNAVVHVIRAEEEADSTGVFQPANAPT